MLNNMRIGIVVLLLPLAVFALVVYVVLAGATDDVIRRVERETRPPEEVAAENQAAWTDFSSVFEQRKFEPVREFAYYVVEPNQTLGTLERHFSVPQQKLAQLNPGPIVPGVTIKVPPVESPMTERVPTPLNTETLTVTEGQGVVTVANTERAVLTTTIPALAAYLQPQGVLTQVAPRHWRLEKSLFLSKNIRLDITDQTIDVLELRSEPGLNASLIARRGEVLIKNVSIRSFNTLTGDVDRDTDDGRSFIKAGENTRMDVLSSEVSFLGASFDGIQQLIPGGQGPPFGISWRSPAGSLGTGFVTGWVQGSSFHNNYFGAYTFGASGMYWGQNHVYDSLFYGLDPHDDSSNALVEGNTFDHNGKHGFIVSERCNNNIIRNNVSFANAGHGFMIHEFSQYNLLENNEAYDNEDNIAIFDSDFTVIRNNRLRDARRSNIRVNFFTDMTYILGNDISGGGHGIYAYNNASNLYIRGNTVNSEGTVLRAKDNTANLLFGENRIGKEDFNFGDPTNGGLFVGLNPLIPPPGEPAT